MNKKLYKSLLLLFAAGILLGIPASKWLPVYIEYAKPCVFYARAGFYCPGCGGTRAVLSLLQGHWIESFRYHPVVLYTFLLFLWYLISNTIEIFSKGKIPIAMKLKVRYLWVALGIILIQWLLKNMKYCTMFLL